METVKSKAIDTVNSTLTNCLIRKLGSEEMFKIPMLMTKAQLEEYRFFIGADKPEPEPEKCTFCGKMLPNIARRCLTTNEITGWIPSHCECNQAKGHRIKLEEEERKKKQADEESARWAEMQKKVNKLLSQSKLGTRFKTRTFETFNVNNNNQRAFEACKKYVEKFENYKKTGIGLMLSGPYGTGKTHLAAAITNELLNQGIPVIFGTLISLLGVIRQSYSENWTQEDEIQILNTYSRVDLLTIDDLGKEKPSEWVLEKLFTIVNTRYENYKPIIFTTNYSIETLKKRLTVGGNIETAESIVSRLYEVCRGIYINGEDQRMKGR